PDGFVDTAELLRAGLLLRLPDETPPVSSTVSSPVSMTHEETPPVSSTVSSVSLPVLERLIDVLQRELDEARLLLREAHARETLLLQMLSQQQQQNQRLLDMPRSLPPQSPQDAPGQAQPPRRVQRASTSPTPPGGPRGAMRRRIVALLQDYPEGL